MTVSAPIRLALIGAGSHSREQHAPALAAYAREFPEQLQLAAVCDLEEAKAASFAAEFGFPTVYTDFREMIARERPDGCVSVMPIPAIAAQATALLEMGMPVSIEKPPGASVAEARALAAVAADSGTPHQVSVDRRFHPLIRRGREWAMNEGPIRLLRAAMLRRNRREDFFVSGTAIHCIDCLRFLGGEVSKVDSFDQRSATPWYHFVFAYTSGVLGVLDVLPTTGQVEETYEILGENYRVRIESVNGPAARLQCWRAGERVVDEGFDPALPLFRRVGAFDETREFVSGLIEGRPLSPSLADILPSLELAYRLNT